MGSGTRTCLDGGLWSGEAPICEGEFTHSLISLVALNHLLKTPITMIGCLLRSVSFPFVDYTLNVIFVSVQCL